MKFEMDKWQALGYHLGWSDEDRSVASTLLDNVEYDTLQDHGESVLAVRDGKNMFWLGTTQIVFNGRYLPNFMDVVERKSNGQPVIYLSGARARKSVEQQEADTEAVEKKGVPGVYVYYFPGYRVPDNGVPCLKVGMSTKDAHTRAKQQGTDMPEKPVVLRVYPTETDKALEVERSIHRLLILGGMKALNSGGKEWFNAPLEFLDHLAAMIGLEIEEVGEIE